MMVLSRLGCRFKTHTVLSGISLSLPPQCVALVGPNGAGKSTLLQLCADGGRYFRQAEISGEIWLDGKHLQEIAPEQLARRRAFLPQQHADTLQLPVRDLLCLAAWPHGGGKGTEKTLEEALTIWELEKLASRHWNQLSGGERQRVQLARSWMQMRLHPVATERIWLLDEPQNALDLPHQQRLHQQLREEAGNGSLVVFSTHDINFALRTADRILVLANGRLQADDVPGAIADPARLQAIFGVPFTRISNPADGKPWLIPG